MGFLSSITSFLKPVTNLLGSVSSIGSSVSSISGMLGGPTSIGGITGPPSGRESGQQAAGYYDEAFPGTNPWERLGAGNPIGALGSAGIAADAATKNVRTQMSQQERTSKRQADASVRVAEINAAGASNVANIHAGPAGVSAAAATSQAASTRARLLIEAEKMLTERGKAFRSPEIAALASRAVSTFGFGMKSEAEWEKHLNDGWFKIYLAAGVAAHTVERGADAVGKVLGARVRGVPARRTGGNRFPTRSSVPAGAGRTR